MIRKAALKDIDQVEKSYVELLTYEQEHTAYTVWKMGVYPTRETAEKSLADETLYVLEQDGEICASMIADQVQPQEYGKIKWNCSAQSQEVFVIHLLCVRPSKSGCGMGKAMVRFAEEEAKRRGLKAVRLDTGAQNTPAAALYRGLGFELAGTSSMAIGGVIAHDDHLFFEKTVAGLEKEKTETWQMFRKATEKDVERIAEIYDEIHTETEAGRMTTNWLRGVYPTKETAEASVRRGDMFVEEDHGLVVAAAKINQEQVAEYSEASWRYDAPGDQVMVLHTLVVSPKAKGRGYGSKFVAFYEKYALEHGCRYLRMDTSVKNLSARALYKKLGYREAGIVLSEFNGIHDMQLVCLEKKV